MAGHDRHVRVFISSTFRDMHAERDHLVTVVFPELRDRLARLGLSLYDVDLRWGVPNKTVDGETANSWAYCRKWIDKVQPFFIGILGQRYGYVPTEEKLMEGEKDKNAEPKYLGRSITEMEIRHGYLDTKLRPKSYFYFRNQKLPTDATPEAIKTYVDVDRVEQLETLKKDILACGRPVRHYDCRWTGRDFDDLQDFGDKVLEDLWSGILRDPNHVDPELWRQVLGCDPSQDARYTDDAQPVPRELWEQLLAKIAPPEKDDSLPAQAEQMARFAQGRLRWFQGRTKELAELSEFIEGDVPPTNDAGPPGAAQAARLCVVQAVAGQGKSALLAKLCQLLANAGQRVVGIASTLDQTPQPRQPHFVIPHFVGATQRSADVHPILQRLLGELDQTGIEWPAEGKTQGEGEPEGKAADEPKQDFDSLRKRLVERLATYAGPTKVVLIIDAVNQLNGGHDLSWLPHQLGPSVRIILSTIEPPAKPTTDNTDIADNKASIPSGSVPLNSPPFQGGAGGGSGDRSPSTPEEKVLDGLRWRHPRRKTIPLSPLTPADVRRIVVDYLEEYCKELDKPHIDAICAMEQARNPLYLLVMLHELRTLGGDDMHKIVPQLIADMSTKYPDTVKLFDWVLERLEVFDKDAQASNSPPSQGGAGGGSDERTHSRLDDDPTHKREAAPPGAVALWCTYIALSRVGMASAELRDLLKLRFGEEGDKLALRTERGLRPYLQHRGRQLDYFHGQLKQAVHARYLADPATCTIRHGELADYFRTLADPKGDDTWTGESPRGFEELPHHLAAANEASRWTQLTAILKRYAFIRGKNERVGAGALIEDYTLRSLGEQQEVTERESQSLQLIQGAIRLSARAIARDEAQLASQLRGRLLGFDLPTITQLLEQIDCETKRPWLRPTMASLLQPGGALVHTLEGHTNWVTSVSQTPDGRRAVSASLDHTLRVWDVETGQCLRTLEGHSQGVNFVSLTPDGRRAASASNDKTLRVWDVETGQCLRALKGHTGSVESVSLTPDGRRAVSASWDRTLRVWDVETGQCLRTLEGCTGTVSSVSLTSDGRRAVSASWDKVLRLWDVETGQSLRTLEGHADKVTSVSLTPDGRRAVSASWDKTLRLWDVEAGQCLRTMAGHTDVVASVSLTPDGRRAVSASYDKTLRVWNLETGECLRTLKGHTKTVTSVSLTPDGRRAVTASWDNTLRVWDGDTGQRLRIAEGHSQNVTSVSLTSDGSRAVSASDDKTLRVWDAGTGQCIRTIEGHWNWVTSVSLTPNGRRAVSASFDNTLRVWDVESGKCLRTMEGHLYPVTSVSLTSDGRRAVSASWERTLRVWDVETGQCLRTLEGHTKNVTSVSLTPDGRRAVSGSDDMTLRVWDVEKGQFLRTMEAHSHPVTSVSLSPDGRRAVSASPDQTRVGYVISGGGLSAVSARGHNSLQVWDVAKGQCVRTMEGHTDPVASVSLTRDGRRAVSASYDKTLRVWDVETGSTIAAFAFEEHACACAVTPNGRTIVVGDSSGRVHFLTLENA